MKPIVLITVLFSLAACGKVFDAQKAATAAPELEEVAERPAGEMQGPPPPPPTANTAAEFDTTSKEEKAAALAAPKPAGEKRLGETIATLGDPTDPGFWLETPLVTRVTQGRVEAKTNGKSVSLELRPIPGADGAGSRISLPALKLLEVGLAGLHEMTVFAD
ncbi:MAG: D-galactarate dehydratase [Maritimibacter sp.]